jgi:hypothetical protein
MKLIAKATVISMLAISPAAAEKFSTVWTLKPVTTVLPTSTALDTTFFEQRAVPYRLVRLTDDLVDGRGKGKPLVKGSLLYLVMDKTNRMAFCSFKDSSGGNVAKSLFIPALDTRPCLVDDDRDGKFEKSFSVFDLWGSIAPTPKGDIAKAKTVAPTAYIDVDPAEAPVDYRLRYEVHAKGKNRKPELRFVFSAKNETPLQSAFGEVDGDGIVSKPFNYKIRMKIADATRAEVALMPTGEDVMVVLFDSYDIMNPDAFPKPKPKKK